jgi:hypothetical protein
MTQAIPTAILLFTLSATLASAQAPTSSAPPPPSSQATEAAPPSAIPSAVLRPALDSLQHALDLLRPDKWKAPATVTAESVSDIASIQRDLERTLPPILTSADAAPGSVPQLLPAYRNIEALYDVLVRVTQTSILAAPAPQSLALQQASTKLQQARRDFGDLLQSASQSQERQLHDAQAQLRTAQNTPPPPAPVCPPPPPPVKKAKPRAKPKPAATTSTTPQTAAPTLH